MFVNDDRIDPELLAAFLEGNATPEERDRIMRTLSTSNAAYAELMEAAAVQRELTDAPSPAVAPPPPPLPGERPPAQRTRGLRYVIPVLLAAGLAFVAISRWSGFGGGAASMVQLAQSTSLTPSTGSGALARTLGDTWSDAPWSGTRGSDAPAVTRARAFRAGARYAELEIAAKAADSTAVLQTVAAMTDVLASTEGGGPFIAMFRAFATSADFGGASQRGDAAKQLREFLGATDWFDLGVWTETARLAIATKQVAFFEPKGRAIAELRRVLQPHIDDAGPDAATWTAVRDALTPVIAGSTWTVNDLETLGAAVQAAGAIAGQ